MIVSTDVYVLPSLNLKVLVMVVVFFPFFTYTDVDVFDDIHPAGIYSILLIMILYHHYYHDDFNFLF